MLQVKIYKYFFLFIACAAFLAQTACKKDTAGASPQIAQIRAISPAPDDSVLTAALPGQVVVIQGANLGGAYDVVFNGFHATLNTALFADNNLVVAVPQIAWDSIPEGKLDVLEVSTPAGTATYTFHITAPAPSITSLSNEMATAGTTLTINGNNFYAISKVIFPGGIEVSDLTVSGITKITLTVPSGITEGGPIQVVGTYGTGTSILLFNDITTGVLCNFDNVNNFSWGCPVSSDAGAYPGGVGSFAQMQFTGVSGNEWSWWNWGRSINSNSGTWIPSDHLSDPLSSYALKFEIYVKAPWSTGSFYIVKDYNWAYAALYTPWKTKADYTTDGWQTVTIPLDQFKTNNGTGDPASSLSALVGSGSGNIDIMFINDTDTPVDNFDAAVDNVRFVKIK